MAFKRLSGFFSEKPWLISLFLLILLSLWLGLGILKAEENKSIPSNSSPDIPLAKVVYQSFIAEPTTRNIELYGRTAPDRKARLGAEVGGRISALQIKKGQMVKRGQALVKIDEGDLNMQLERFQAQYRVKQKEFKAAQSLKSRGLQGEVAYATAQAALTEAKAMVENAQLALKNTVVRAPFDGVIEHLHIELGDYASVGDPIADLIDLSQLVIEADVSERHIQQLQMDQSASVRFINGQVEQGKVRFISRMSSVATNTFPIEILLPNKDFSIPAGISAEVELALEETRAIKVTPAMLALDERGNLGVKVLENKESIKFVPIQLVKAQQDGVWLSGLGDSVDIVTIGQGFVRDGDTVQAISQLDIDAQREKKLAAQSSEQNQ